MHIDTPSPSDILDTPRRDGIFVLDAMLAPGGGMRHGERKLVRIHCFEPERRTGGLVRGMIGGFRAALAPNPFRWG